MGEVRLKEKVGCQKLTEILGAIILLNNAAIHLSLFLPRTYELIFQPSHDNVFTAPRGRKKPLGVCTRTSKLKLGPNRSAYFFPKIQSKLKNDH